jgi:hypothetical protein
VRTYWTADTTRDARHTWRPIAGNRASAFDDVVVLASQALTAAELTALGAFPYQRAEPFNEEHLGADEVIEAPVLSHAAALRALPAMVEAREEAAVEAELPGDSRKVHCDQLVTGVSGQLALLPVWIVAYRYGDQAFRFLANGQTGTTTGTAPISTLKVVLAIVAVVGTILVGLLLCWVLSGFAGGAADYP